MLADCDTFDAARAHDIGGLSHSCTSSRCLCVCPVPGRYHEWTVLALRLAHRLPSLDDARQRGFRPSTLAGDKGYDTRQCVKDMRDRGVTPHVAQRTHSAIDGRTTRHPGYGVRQKIRKQIEEIFGWMKTWEDSAEPGIGVWSVLGWPGTLWLRPTIWCGWRTCCRVRGLGTFRSSDLPGAQCAQVG